MQKSSNAISDLFNERRAKFTNLRSVQNESQPSDDGQKKQASQPSNPADNGWRMVGKGSKIVFRQDWSKHDSKTAEKVPHTKNRRIQNLPTINNNKYNNNKNNNNTNKNNNNIKNNNNNKNKNNKKNSVKKPDKQLLDMAKRQFSSPPESTDHPIAALSIPAATSFITFKKGETINQQPPAVHHQQQFASNQQQLQQNQQQQQQQIRENHIQLKSNPNMPQQATGKQTNDIHSLPSTDGQFELDPMRPPIVRLTQQSVLGDGRYLKARLRDPKIMKIVRLYLAYMKDQPPTVCIEGMTPTSIRMLLASEGLPTIPDHLQRIFIEVHQEYGVNATEAAADLHSYGRFLASERTNRLQHLRESAHKFHSPASNFRK